MHVLVEVERGRVDPQRSAQAPPGDVQHLAQPRGAGQVPRDRLPHPLQLEAAAGIQQPGTVEDGQGADVHRPPEIIWP